VGKLLHGPSRAFLGDRMYKSSAVAEMGDRGHSRHGPKVGGGCANFAGGSGSPSNIMWPGLRSPSVPSGIFIPYQVASSSIYPFGHYRHGPKTGAVHLLERGDGSPSNTTSLR